MRLSIVLTLLGIVVLGCRENRKLPQNSSDLARRIQEKANTIHKNDKGYWEAELLDKHTVVQIPSGAFQMGSDQGEAKELPIHQVHLDEFWISKYPVTVNQFAKFVEETGYVTDAERGEGCWIEEGGKIRYDVSWRNPNFEQGTDHPVICVSWNDATAYTEWLSEKTGLSVQLPTEAQWEKAARGFDQRLWPWGNEVPNGSQANFAENQYIRRFGTEMRNPSPGIDDGFPQTSPVDAYSDGQSPYGVYDMGGNVIDWLYDWFDADQYSNSAKNNPIGDYKNPIRRKFETERGWGDNLQRSIRGGAWTDASGELSLAEGGHSIRADMREHTDQYSCVDHLGFRFVIDEHHRYVDAQPDFFTGSQAAIMESVGDAQLTIDYDRLLTDGEKPAFGTSIPYGMPWSPGAISASVFSVSKPIKIHEAILQPGSYNLYLLPKEISPERTPGTHTDWTLIFTQPARFDRNEFNPDEEVARLSTRAQLEDNSKQQMEFFFDQNEEGRIVRFLHEFVEVHIPIVEAVYDHGETAKAMVMNAMDSTQVKVNYYREVAAKRTIYGEVVPFDEPWPGEHRPTTVEFSGDVLFQDKPVPKGKYELNIIPKKEKDWTLTLRDATQEQGAEVFNEVIEVSLSDSGPDRLEYYFDYVSPTERNLVFTWDKATVVFTVKPDSEIKKETNGE